MTDFLYARPSIIEGIGRNMDFYGSLNSYNYSKNGEEADKLALANDFLVIYMDLYKAYIKTICQIEAKETAV
jgi:poly(3-hydroxybutyrate) depolymerase